MIELGEPVPAGRSGLLCPACAYNFTLREASGLIDLPTCPGCDLVNEVPAMVVRPLAQALPLLKDEVARAARWYHITQRRSWLPSVIEQDVPVYVGTELAAFTRARDDQLRERGTQFWWLHELELASNTTFRPGIEPDRENNWLLSLAELEDFAGEEVDAVRYINGYEDPGSVQLLVDPNFLQSVRITTIPTREIDRHLLRVLEEREQSGLSGQH